MPAQKTQPHSSINLLPRKQLDTTTGGKLIQWLLSGFRTIVIVVQVIVLVSFVARMFLDARLRSLNNEIEEKYALVNSYADVEKRFLSAKFKLDTFNSLQNPDNKFSILLTSVSNVIPPDVQLVSITNSEGVLVINALTSQQSSMYSFANQISQIEGLSNAQVVNIQQDTGSINTEFTINANILSQSNPIS